MQIVLPGSLYVMASANICRDLEHKETSRVTCTSERGLSKSSLPVRILQGYPKITYLASDGHVECGADFERMQHTMADLGLRCLRWFICPKVWYEQGGPTNSS